MQKRRLQRLRLQMTRGALLPIESAGLCANKKAPKPECSNCEISLRRIIEALPSLRFHAKVVNFKKGTL